MAGLQDLPLTGPRFRRKPHPSSIRRRGVLLGRRSAARRRSLTQDSCRGEAAFVPALLAAREESRAVSSRVAADLPGRVAGRAEEAQGQQPLSGRSGSSTRRADTPTGDRIVLPTPSTRAAGRRLALDLACAGGTAVEQPRGLPARVTPLPRASRVPLSTGRDSLGGTALRSLPAEYCVEERYSSRCDFGHTTLLRG